VKRAYLALGSNIGDRLAHLQSAVDGLGRATAVRVLAISRVYETDPVGGPEQDAYLNAVVAIDCALAPHELLAFAQELERAEHRVREERWGPRTLDVDVLLYDDEHIDTAELKIPHPRMWERGFVLAPLRDVVPALVPADATWNGVHVAPVELHNPWSDDNAPSR
jgi:2-amino-4-hydroxy-6-hydroxymethyldihydropteridine diphosphokinase